MHPETLKPDAIDGLRELFAAMPAAMVAELFLSPYIRADFLNIATQDEGPSLWIVNRSDVYDQTLEHLKAHPVTAMAARAQEKLATRRSSLTLLSPPMLEGPLEDVPDFMIEDVLGHPLVPLEATLFFTKHLLEDYRASAALSLTRRLLEHPPNFDGNAHVKSTLIDQFGDLLLNDSSPYVRSYAARIPLFPSSLISEAFQKENHGLVQGRLLQNPACPRELLEKIHIAPERAEADQLFVSRVAAIDERYPEELRKMQLKKSNKRDPISVYAHRWHLDNSSH